MILLQTNTITSANEVLQFLNLNNELFEYVNDILEYIFEPRFSSEEKNINQDNKFIFFDFEKDYDLIYANFLRYYQINLNKDDINWMEFNFLLEDLLLTENSLSKRIGFRSCNTPKNTDPNHSYIKKMKEKYSLIPKKELIATNMQMVSGFFTNLMEKRFKKDKKD